MCTFMTIPQSLSESSKSVKMNFSFGQTIFGKNLMSKNCFRCRVVLHVRQAASVAYERTSGGGVKYYNFSIGHGIM